MLPGTSRKSWADRPAEGYHIPPADGYAARGSRRCGGGMMTGLVGVTIEISAYPLPEAVRQPATKRSDEPKPFMP